VRWLALVIAMLLAPPAHAGRLPACDAPIARSELGDRAPAALRGLSGEAFDVAWLSQMLAHHDATLRLARRALAIERDPAVRAAAVDVMEQDAREAAELRRVLQQRYRRGPDRGQQALFARDVMALVTEPIRTRADFLHAMVLLDTRAVELARLARARAEHAETLAVAERFLVDEAADVGVYRTLLAG
jgi:uncharacterized protein (DUF305 family)